MAAHKYSFYKNSTKGANNPRISITKLVETTVPSHDHCIHDATMKLDHCTTMNDAPARPTRPINTASLVTSKPEFPGRHRCHEHCFTDDTNTNTAYERYGFLRALKRTVRQQFQGTAKPYHIHAFLIHAAS
jgi:hypothetical protein